MARIDSFATTYSIASGERAVLQWKEDRRTTIPVWVIKDYGEKNPSVWILENPTLDEFESKDVVLIDEEFKIALVFNHEDTFFWNGPNLLTNDCEQTGVGNADTHPIC